MQGLTKDDTKVWISGCDIDGTARGKLLSREKIDSGLSLGFCNVIFAWDCLDKNYHPKPPAAMQNTGFKDIIAQVDTKTMRRDPITNIPHFLVDFKDENMVPLEYCPRSLLKRVLASNSDYLVLAGVEFEFYNYKETEQTLAIKKANIEYFHQVFDLNKQFGIPIECYHTETGPGVYEAALQYCEALEMADRAHLFKLMTKKIGLKHGIIPCFMAKPYSNLPGCSGHIHLSLNSKDGKNLFHDNNSPDKTSKLLKSFAAGVLLGLPSIMALVAPNINSYKRLNINFWAPVNISVGFDDRCSALRIINPPICSPQATRIEIRVPGADINSYLALSGIIACGYYGIKHNLDLPSSEQQQAQLPATLTEAIAQMNRKDSIARQVLGNEFVDHYVATRLHEVREYNSTITDWEISRYMETC